MFDLLMQPFRFIAPVFKTRFGLQAEKLALRHQLCLFYSERLNGSIRRECLDRVIILSEGHLYRTLKKYFDYYNRFRVHQSLEMDVSEGRRTQALEKGNVIAIPHVGGLHHHYERKAA